MHITRQNRFLSQIAGLAAFLVPFLSFGQYEDNPLKNKRWATFSAGLNTADNVSWQVLGAWSGRGEVVVSQFRLAYSQEFIEASDDLFTARKNRIMEAAYMLGDGWGGKRWYATGSLGFGFMVRMYEDWSDYNMRYITATSPCIPAQIEVGVFLSKRMGINIVGVGNLNFREHYYGMHLGVFFRVEN